MKCGRSLRKGDVHIDYLLPEKFLGVRVGNQPAVYLKMRKKQIEEKLCNINGTGEKSVLQKLWKRN